MSNHYQLVWFRNDLRVSDNPALYHAAQQGTVIGVYLEPTEQRALHHDAACKLGLIYDSLMALRAELNRLNIPLHIYRVDTYQDCPSKLLQLAKQFAAKAVHFNNEYPLNEQRRDASVAELLTKQGVTVKRYDGDLILPPSQVRTQDGQPYQVFTPYKKAWIRHHQSQSCTTLAKPKRQQYVLGKQAEYDFRQDYRRDLWPAGEAAAQTRLQSFLNRIEDYSQKRDIPAVKGTSCLSPYLTVGALSARQCVAALTDYYQGEQERLYADSWLSELVWREFYRQLMIDNPQLSYHKPYKTEAKEVWCGDHQLFEQWCEGKTGFPLIDAAIRQLRQTGWMHNRLRMNVAMFLNKLCLVDWRKGERFFMQQLIDGDFASNNGGWQWCSSTGADAAPYFRIMNPITQSQRFDPEGLFIRKLLPELASLNNKDIHFPTPQQREQLGYPQPIIDYKQARQTALELLA